MTLRQLFPAPTPPPLEPLRPDTAQDPPVELSEELADVGPVVVQAPAAKDRVDLGYQLRDGYRSLAPGMPPDAHQPHRRAGRRAPPPRRPTEAPRRAEEGGAGGAAEGLTAASQG